MDTIRLFTIDDHNAGKAPTGLRSGVPLDVFKVYPERLFCFSGIDKKGVIHTWKATGHKNGSTKRMASDLVIEVPDPEVTDNYLVFNDRFRSSSLCGTTENARECALLNTQGIALVFRVRINRVARSAEIILHDVINCEYNAEY